MPIKVFLLILGEKLVSDAFADANRVVFNTYLPTTGANNCEPGLGKQRTYSYSLLSGMSLLESPFIEFTSADLPPDVNAYCDASFCTIVANQAMLSDNFNGGKGNKKCKGNDCFPFIFEVPDSHKGAKVVKTGWTDMFNTH